MAKTVTTANGLDDIPSPVDAAQLTSLIDFEINRIDAEESRPGWTRWALFASVASAFWLFTLELESNNFSWRGVFFVFLGLWICYEMFEQVRILFDDATGHQRLDLLNQLLLSFLSIAFFRLLILISLIVIASRFAHALGPVFSIGVYVFVGLSIAISSVALILMILLKTLVELPMLESPKTSVRSAKLFFLIHVALGCFALFEVVRSIWVGLIIPTPAEYRMGGILFGMGIIIIMLLRQPAKKPIGDALLRIRRNLVLGKLDLDAARNEFEIAMIGLSAPVILQKDISEFFELDQKLVEKYRESIQVFHEVLDAVAKYKGSEQQKLLVRQSLINLGNVMSGWKQAMYDPDKKLNDIEFKIKLYGTLFPQSFRETQNLFERFRVVRQELDAEINDLNRQFEKEHKKAERLIKKLESEMFDHQVDSLESR
jgi:hypothetical protein